MRRRTLKAAAAILAGAVIAGALSTGAAIAGPWPGTGDVVPTGAFWRDYVENGAESELADDPRGDVTVTGTDPGTAVREGADLTTVTTRWNRREVQPGAPLTTKWGVLLGMSPVGARSELVDNYGTTIVGTYVNPAGASATVTIEQEWEPSMLGWKEVGWSEPTVTYSSSTNPSAAACKAELYLDDGKFIARLKGAQAWLSGSCFEDATSIALTQTTTAYTPSGATASDTATATLAIPAEAALRSATMDPPGGHDMVRASHLERNLLYRPATQDVQLTIRPAMLAATPKKARQTYTFVEKYTTATGEFEDDDPDYPVVVWHENVVARTLLPTTGIKTKVKRPGHKAKIKVKGAAKGKVTTYNSCSGVTSRTRKGKHPMVTITFPRSCFKGKTALIGYQAFATRPGKKALSSPGTALAPVQLF